MVVVVPGTKPHGYPGTTVFIDDHPPPTLLIAKHCTLVAYSVKDKLKPKYSLISSGIHFSLELFFYLQHAVNTDGDRNAIIPIYVVCLTNT